MTTTETTMTTPSKTPTMKILTARAGVGCLGSEEWAVQTICAQSGLDVHPTEVAILVHRGDVGQGVRYVLSGGSILGSYVAEVR
jgi:hypothetical protein